MSDNKIEWSLPNNELVIKQIAISIYYQLRILPKWLFLKIVASALKRKRNAYDTDLKIIKLGNKLFGRRYPRNIHDDYSTYISLFPGDIGLFSKIAPPNWYKSKKLLEIGSGLGQYTFCFAKAGADHVAGIEYQQEKVRFAQRYYSSTQSNNVTYQQGNAEELNFPDNTFDAVFSHAVFEHISDPRRALKEGLRVVKPNGRAFLTIDYLQGPWGDHLYDFVNFPWARWVVSESSLCRYWSHRLQEEQADGKMRFYPKGTQISSLGGGSEIHLNRWNSEQMEQAMLDSGWIIEKKVPGMLIAALLPFCFPESLSFRFFVHGGASYRLRKR